MKLALCLFHYFPYGGLQRDFLRIATQLATIYPVEIFTTRWQGNLPNHLPIHFIKVNGISNHRRMQMFGHKIQAVAAQQGCQFLIGFNKIPGLAVYFSADNCYIDDAKQQHGRWYRYTPRYRCYAQLENSVFSKSLCTKILLLTKQQKKIYQKQYQTQDERFFILPAQFEDSPALKRNKIIVRTAHHLSESDKLLLMVCSAFKTKGVDRALATLAWLNQNYSTHHKLIIIGNDNPAPYIKLAKNLNVNHQIEFLGSREDVADYLYAADLFLHPARKEAAGKVLLEAMSCTLPIVTTTACGYAEHIMNANAGIVLPETSITPERLGKAIVHLLTESDENKAQRKEGIKTYVAHHRGTNLSQAAVTQISHWLIHESIPQENPF